MTRSIAAVCTIALFLGGCAIHPLPEDVTRHTTLQIVHKIRCEGREALDNITMEILREYGDERVRQLADRIAAKELSAHQLIDPQYRQILAVGLQKRGRDLLETYTLSAVTFDFSFDITETNDNRTEAGFKLPFIDGVFDLTTRAGAKFERQAWRKFQVTDTFAELHTLDRSYCDSVVAKVGNFAYPIVGKIGLEEVFRTFVDLDQTVGGLATAGPERFSDLLRFITTVNADANPTLSLVPLPDRFRLVSASANFIAQRADEHQVTVALARGPRFEGLKAARATAAQRSRVVADERRVEDIVIIPRNRALIIR